MIGTGSSEKDNRMFKICPKFVLYVLPSTLGIVHSERQWHGGLGHNLQRFRFEIQTETGPGGGAGLEEEHWRLPGTEAGQLGTSSVRLEY